MYTSCVHGKYSGKLSNSEMTQSYHFKYLHQLKTKERCCGREASYGRFSSKHSSVQLLSCLLTLQPHGLQHTRLFSPSPSPGVCSNSGPLSRWCHPTISSSVVPFSFCLQFFPASGSFPMSQFFTSAGQSIEASASALVLPKNIRDWFPLEFRRGTVISKRKESVILDQDQDTPDWGMGERKRTAGGLYHADFL